MLITIFQPTINDLYFWLMGNKATTIEEQIALLKERGMVIDLNNQKVKEILLDIGYYRLGFYQFPFCDKEHNLNPNTKFSDIVSLYYLDVNLRNILTQYINRIEINFRTKIVYYVSNKYKSSPTWFINPKIVSPKFIKDIDKHYSEDFKRSNNIIGKTKCAKNFRYGFQFSAGKNRSKITKFKHSLKMI